MDNRAMYDALRAGKALSVLAEGQQISDSTYLLRRFVPDVDYCDPKRERWIWSVGRNVFDGRICAATDARFYEDPNWECLFLR